MYSIHHFIVIFIAYIAKFCIGSELNDSNSDGKFWGYKSAFGPTTTYIGTLRLECYGAYACSSMEFMKFQTQTLYRYIWCGGTNSCSNTTIIYGYNQVYLNIAHCWGYNACIGSNIKYTNNVTSYSNVSYLKCGGCRSCSHANISGVSEVHADAPLSLYRAVIDTIGIIATTVNIRLRAPFAAYGAHLICRANHICKIYCQSITACYNLYIDCMAPGGKNCDISSNIANSNVPITNFSYFSTISYDSNIFADFAAINTDILCPNNGSYDIYMPESDTNITLVVSDQGPICCRGADTCRSKIIKYETQKKTDLICSASYACRGSHISHINDTVFCEGESSCYDSTIRHIDYVYCTGAYSCASAYIFGVNHIKCDGSNSCQWTTFRSNGVDLVLYLNAYYSAEGAYIYCDKTDVCTINCIGYESCLYTSVFCDINAVNCIINCDIEIVGECPTILVLTTTTSISTTSIGTTSIDTTIINTSSIRISTTTIDSTTIDTSSINTALINSTSIISIQDDEDDKQRIVIAVVSFLGGSCFIIATVTIVKILRSQKKQKKEENISMMNAVIAPKHDDMKQKKQSAEAHKDENEVETVDEVGELQKDESLTITVEGSVDLKEWSHVEVAEWVKTVNNCMFAEYLQSVVDNEIDGNVLCDMTLQQLQLRLDMNNMVKGLQFYNLIQTLKHDQNINEKVIKPISVQKVNFEENVEMQTTGNTTIGEINEIKSQRVLFSEWLTNKVKLPQYYNLLVQNGYESLDSIKQVTNEEELKHIGIYKKGHLRKLIKEIKGLTAKKRNNINKKNSKTHDETVTNLTDGETLTNYNLDLVDDIYVEEDKNQQNGQQQSILATTHKKEGTHYYDKYQSKLTDGETVTNYNLDLVDDIYAEEPKNQQNGQQQTILATTQKKEGTNYYDKYHHQKHQDNMNEVQIIKRDFKLSNK